MKYPISFEIDINEKMVRDNVAKEAKEVLIRKIVNDAEAIIFTHKSSLYHPYGYGLSKIENPDERNGISEEIKSEIVNFMENNKEVIIEKAAENLAKRLAMSKQGKELLNGLSSKMRSMS